jgi:thiamine pyrophosphate-dependent acetolactate synthase large subunit-like protein
MPTGGELLARALGRAGVEVVFGLPGAHNLPAWNALAASPIRLVTVRHEQAAVYAADGYARATGRLGVALTTTGPGAANALAATGEAWASRSPVLVISTDVPTALRRPGTYRGVLHETTDQPGMFVPVTKAVVRAGRLRDLVETAERAIGLALATPARPVYFELPVDVLADTLAPAFARAAEDSVADFPPPATPPVDGADDELRAALALLDRAQSPIVWAGGGATESRAGAAIGRLAERLAAPIVSTYRARGIAGADHPCAIELPPHVPEVGRIWDRCDLVLAFGSDFDGMTTQNWAMPQPKRLVAVNVDPADAAKAYAPDVVVPLDAAAAADALAGEVAPRGAALEGCARGVRELHERAWSRLRREHPREVAFVRGVRRSLPDDAVVVCDMCIPGYWLGGFLPVDRPRAIQYPVGWGTLGYAFPAALGAALAGGGPAVSFSGDGGFLFACGELATAKQERIPLTAVVIDDGGYGMLRYDQRRTLGTLAGIDLETPDYAALAATFGVESETVDGLGEVFGEALFRHASLREPTLLVARAALDPPPTTSPRWYRRG